VPSNVGFSLNNTHATFFVVIGPLSGENDMLILAVKSLLLLVTATVICSIGGRAFAAEDCPKEKRKVCIQETVAGHTFKHPALTNECLAAKFGGKILNEGDCPH
jgi:hypothetical protein